MSRRGQKALDLLPERIQKSVSRSWKDDENGLPWWLGWAFVEVVIVLWANRRRREREERAEFLLSTSWTETPRLGIAPSVPEPKIETSPAVVTVEDIPVATPAASEPVEAQAEAGEAAVAEVQAESPSAETVEPAEEAAAPKEQDPDDLDKIEGIGPKIASLLQSAGITTFAGLAATDVDQLREIVHGAGLNFADPSTWPDQARLAADGDWDGLKHLQESLKGGRQSS